MGLCSSGCVLLVHFRADNVGHQRLEETGASIARCLASKHIGFGCECTNTYRQSAYRLCSIDWVNMQTYQQHF